MNIRPSTVILSRLLISTTALRTTSSFPCTVKIGPLIHWTSFPRMSSLKFLSKSCSCARRSLGRTSALSSSRQKLVRLLSHDAPPSTCTTTFYVNDVLSNFIGVTPDQLHADGWAIGFDERFPSNKRIQQALMFARWSRHENLYAHPLVSAPLLGLRELL